MNAGIKNTIDKIRIKIKLAKTSNIEVVLFNPTLSRCMTRGFNATERKTARIMISEI